MNQIAADGLVRDILLRYLQRSSVVDWPGADGLTEDDILDRYPLAIALGEAPGHQQLCRAHPELTSEIQTLFQSRKWIDPLRPHMDTNGTGSRKACCSYKLQIPSHAAYCEK